MKLFRSLYIKTQYLKIAIKNIYKPKLGDIVRYNNEQCMLIQGVAAPLWDLMPISEENLNKEERVVYRKISEDDFKLKKTLKRLVFSLKSTYKFYMGYWYVIDLNKTGKISFHVK